MAIKRLYDTLVGATVRVNQLYKNEQFGTSTESGVTYTKTSDYVWTLNGTASATNTKSILASSAMTQNHVYYVGNFNSFGGTLEFLFNGWKNSESIVKKTDAQNLQLRHSASAVFNNAEVELMLIDLTAMLGSTIADYLYSIETATAGAGIEKLREWGFLTGRYIPYNPGSLESVEARSHVMRGFNQWDEEWEVGGISYATGGKDNATNRIRSKNYIPVIGSKTYFIKDFGVIACFDADKNYLGNAPYTRVSGGYLLNLSADTRYILFSMIPSYGTTYHNDICINLSSDRNGEYEPYSVHTYDLGTDTLRGLFKLDSENRLYADGDTKTSDGVITRKYGVVDLGTLNWTYNSVNGMMYANFGTVRYNDSFGYPFICSYPKFIFNKMPGTDAYKAWDNTYTADCLFVCPASISSTPRIYVRDTAYTDAATFKSAMSGVMLVYELATPTTETSAPFTSPQICDPDGTEEYITGNGVPVGHETRYQL